MTLIFQLILAQFQLYPMPLLVVCLQFSTTIMLPTLVTMDIVIQEEILQEHVDQTAHYQEPPQYVPVSYKNSIKWVNINF